jgi:hypothetical protein
MTQNDFSKCGPAIENVDIEQLERELGVSLPASMKALYLKYNGGMPTRDWFPMADEWEPIWIHEFLPIATTMIDRPTIRSMYFQVVGKAGYPQSFIPFAVDPGTNLFCLDSADGSIHYWLTDVSSDDLSVAENRGKADRFLTESFERFLEALVSEDDAFG